MNDFDTGEPGVGAGTSGGGVVTDRAGGSHRGVVVDRGPDRRGTR